VAEDMEWMCLVHDNEMLNNTLIQFTGSQQDVYWYDWFPPRLRMNHHTTALTIIATTIATSTIISYYQRQTQNFSEISLLQSHPS